MTTWHTPTTAREMTELWPDVDTLDDATLAVLLDAAKEQVIAYAPLTADAAPDPEPEPEPEPEPAGDFTWQGRDWMLRTDAGAPHYNGQWASETGVEVDEDGHLRLSLQRINDVVHAAEVFTVQQGFGYGRYRWTVGTPAAGLYSNIILGLFTYDPAVSPTNNEIDIELGGWSWGAPAWDHTYFRPGIDPEPDKQPVGMIQFPGTADPVTVHEFEWMPGRIVWRSWLNGDPTTTPDRESVAIHGQPYTYENTNGTFTGTHAIPVPANERIHMNVWVYSENPGSPADDTPATEFVIEGFEYTPLATVLAERSVRKVVTFTSTVTGVTGTVTAEKDADGYVDLYGSFANATGASIPTTTVLGAIPEGFRPAGGLRPRVSVWDNGSATAEVSISDGARPTGPGEIITRTAWAASQSLYFTGIRYKAASHG